MTHTIYMRYGALFGWGIVLYAIMYLLWSGLVLYGFVGGIAPRLLGLAVLVAIAFVATRSLRIYSWKDMLPYSAIWTLEVAVLDAIFTVPYTGWGLYGDWNVWVGYLLVLLVPIIVVATERSRRGQ
jgi:hypothetical protein